MNVVRVLMKENMLSYIEDLSVERNHDIQLHEYEDKNPQLDSSFNIDVTSRGEDIFDVRTKIDLKLHYDGTNVFVIDLIYLTRVKIVSENMNTDDLKRNCYCDIQKEIFPQIRNIVLIVSSESNISPIRLDTPDFEQALVSK